MITTEDIVTLIKTCKTSGVQKLKFGNLQLEFSQPEAASRPLSPKDIRTEIEREIAADEDLHDLHMQNLMLEDPEAYEEEMRKVAYAEVRVRTQRDIQTVRDRAAVTLRGDQE